MVQPFGGALARNLLVFPQEGGQLQRLQMIREQDLWGHGHAASFDIDDLHAAVKKALQLGAVGFDAVKHLVLCQVEKRPPRLDLDVYPYLPRTTVATTSAASYMSLLSKDAA
jgi:hypothetical protein